MDLEVANEVNENFLEPFIDKSVPAGLIPNLKLTFDEFVSSHPNITIKKLPSNQPNDCDNSDKSYTILEVAKQLRENNRKKDKKYGYSYSFSLAKYEEIDSAFNLPTSCQTIDLFSQYWPKKSMSRFLKYKSKSLYCYTKGYNSKLEKLYGGMCEWIYLLTGKIDFVLFKPTKINLAKFSHLQSDEEFIPESGTSECYTLNEGEFFYIPSSWITTRAVDTESFAIIGEFLNHQNISNQLNSFEQDVLVTNGRYSLDRDCEIRQLYWFTAANWLSLESKTVFNNLDNNVLLALKEALFNWKKLQKTTIAPHVYAPVGIQISQICKDFSNVITVRSNRTRAPLKDSTDSVDLIVVQAPANNHPD